MPLDFDTDIRPLFSDHDVEQMQFEVDPKIRTGG